MSKIYLWCEALGTGSGNVSGSAPGGDVLGRAMAEDGTGLASHLSSGPNYSKHDMGLTSDWKHEIYNEKYPDGFELEWIDEENLDDHEGFGAAYELNQMAKLKEKE